MLLKLLLIIKCFQILFFILINLYKKNQDFSNKRLKIKNFLLIKFLEIQKFQHFPFQIKIYF